MAHSLILPLSQCSDPSLVGGKAVGLARLLALGFSVPNGICITTEAYHRTLRAVGFLPNERWQWLLERPADDRLSALADWRALIQQVDISTLVEGCVMELGSLSQLSTKRWALRSSATNEDTVQASFAGLYKTELGVSHAEFGRAIKELWASLWEERVLAYLLRSGAKGNPPAMAVVLQPMLDAQVAGVAYSIHPVTGRANQVMINAVRGLAALLVEGVVEPDQYVIEQGTSDRPQRIRRRVLSRKAERLVMGAEGLQMESIPVVEQDRSSLSDPQLFELALMAKGIERAFHHPVDLEWAFEGERLWILQARPITAVQPTTDLLDEDCEWSRTNFKETMPEVPSPMGRSFLEHFMEAYILSHYLRLGCRIPPGLSSVRTLHGRPYLNASLFHSLVGQLRGNPSLNVEQMGGEPLQTIPTVKPLGWLAFIRAGWLMWREMERVTKSGPGWFAEMKELASTYREDRIKHLSIEALGETLNELAYWLDRREVTFGIAGGVGQCLQTFSLLLPRWLGGDWRGLLNAALQGQGTVISAQQIIRLAELVEMARTDDSVLNELRRQGSTVSVLRQRLRGRPFLAAFDRYLEDYGHRGLGESDVMSPRFADQPDALLAVLAVQLDGPATTPAGIAARQWTNREKALTTIKSRFGWRLDRWLIFQWWYRRLCRFYALREANRHHLMYYSTAARNLLLRLGEQLVERGVFVAREDIFFLTLEERVELSSGISKDWVAIVTMRRTDHERWRTLQVPDTIRDWEEATQSDRSMDSPNPSGLMRGIPISLGRVTGPARIVRSMGDWGKVAKGDILVVPVIDPGMAPLFGIAAGLVAEMGGTLSHGAIIAREYGLPAVANVPKVTEMLKDGDRIRLDAGAGELCVEGVAEHKVIDQRS